MTSQLADFMVPKLGAVARLDATTRVYDANDVLEMSVPGVDLGALGTLAPGAAYETFVEGAVLYDGEHPENRVAEVVPLRGAASSELVVFNPNPAVLSAAYLRCVLRSERFIAHACRVRDLRRARGIQYAKLLEFPMSLPSLERQAVLARRCGDLESLIAQQELALGSLEDVPAALFDEAFGDPLANPRGLTTVPFGECGVRVATSRANAELRPRLASSDIGSGFIVQAGVSEAPPSETDVMFAPRDVLIACTGSPILRAAIAPDALGRGHASRQLVIIRVDEQHMLPAYLCAFLNHPSVVRIADRLAAGSTTRRLAIASLLALRVPVPALSSQTSFAARAKALDSLATLAAHANQAMAEASLALESSLFSFDTHASKPLTT